MINDLGLDRFALVGNSQGAASRTCKTSVGAVIPSMRLAGSCEFEALIGWFTEGFDTADLKEAKALLNKLT